MKNKNDLRVIKTQKILFDTLIELMKNDSFENIKVSDICSKAMINRSTFYSHYNDKYELLVDFLENLKKSLTDALEKNTHIINTKNYYIETIKLLLNHIEEKKDIYYSILINNRDSIIMDIIFDALSNDVNKRIEKTIKNDIPSEVVSKFYLGAVVGLGLEWINNNKYTKEEIINYLNFLIPDNIC